MTFKFASTERKFTLLTGLPYNYSGNNDLSKLEEQCTKVLLRHPRDVYEARNWCQKHFGDQWINFYLCFYF